MRETDLPSPAIGGKGHHLRRVAANCISQLEINSYSNGRHPQAQLLSDFFAACVSGLSALVPVAPTLTFTPGSKSYSIATGAGQAGPALNKGGSEGVVTYTSSNTARATVDPTTGAVTPLTTGTCTITANCTASGGYLAASQTYTATVTA